MIEGIVVEGTDVLTRGVRERLEHVMMNQWTHAGFKGMPEFYWCRPLFNTDDPLQIKWRCYLTRTKE